jgi:oxygen-independent coproporphyrinogen-3 oxidase
MQHAAAGNAVAEEAEITRDELGFEFMLNASRLTEGFDVRLFNERTGLGLNGIEQGLNLAESKGLIERDHKRIRPTALGQRFLNDLQQIFLPE